MKRLLTTLVVLTGLFGSGGAVWAQDLNKGLKAAQSGDFATALKEWKPLAEQGDAVAQYNLGLMYKNGWGVTQDYAEAVKWYRKAAEQHIMTSISFVQKPLVPADTLVGVIRRGRS